jgi:hypothetical protein
MGLRLNKILAQEFSAPYGKDKRPIQKKDLYIIPLRNDVLSKLIHDLLFDQTTLDNVNARVGGR